MEPVESTLIMRTVSPYPSVEPSRGLGNSRLSPKKKVQVEPSPIVKRKTESALSGCPLMDETTKPTLFVTLSRKPLIREEEPSAQTKNASTGVDSVASLSISNFASSMEMAFELIAKDQGLSRALWWADTIGFKPDRLYLMKLSTHLK